jgi:hypothetical protein
MLVYYMKKKSNKYYLYFFSPFIHLFDYINGHVWYLNNSKYFAGVVMIMLNIGSKFISYSLQLYCSHLISFST